MSLTAQELLDLIFGAKRLEDLQNQVRNTLIQKLMDTPGARGAGLVVDQQIPCRPQLSDERFPEVDGACS